MWNLRHMCLNAVWTALNVGCSNSARVRHEIWWDGCSGEFNLCQISFVCKETEERLPKLLKSFPGKSETNCGWIWGTLQPKSLSDGLPSRALVLLNEWKIADAHFDILNCLKRPGIKAWKLPIWSARFEGLEKSEQIMFLQAPQLLEGRKLPWLLPISASNINSSRDVGKKCKWVDNIRRCDCCEKKCSRTKERNANEAIISAT